ncbi:ribosomal-protein-alanine N-acetyltransferase [Thalassotalea euphylliae]|uniref:[Ribosomal protein bS18]-alanine N-acetyltransferase n=1 Tax=Thalassotalea euphylliae TaxID=1655234 RepID=A0A3E0TTX3_9GAMM|nr:ribosomal protein S18-alanine N-acetyltransferase [Thalassotalea euphylliae]REL28126.1 ribosomal-protein-alanine N-acetyltransferase [Thalassotalea euphylliae]
MNAENNIKLSYQPITQDDVIQLMPIENACHTHPWTEKLFRSCVGGRYFGEYAQLTDSKGNQKLVGFYIGEYILGEATLMNICVNPIEQGQGFGNALLTQFITQAKNLGGEQLWLDVRTSNTAAIMLYINHGFTEISRRTGYYPTATGYEDSIVMGKKIS